MAVIPTADADRVVPVARRPDVIDRSASIGAAAVGDAANTVRQTFAGYEERADQFALAKARGNLLNADLATRKALENDQDFATLEQRYTDKLTTARDQASSSLTNPHDRELFDLASQEQLAVGTAAIRQRARSLEVDHGRADLEGLMADSRRVGLEASDEATRRASITNVQTALSGAVQRGYLSADQAGTAGRNFIANYGEGFVETQPLPEQLKLLRNPKGTLADYIDPAKRAELARQVENTLRAQADRLDARGERAIAKMDQQIASGVPMSPEVVAGFERDTRSTPYASDFQDRITDEKRVQEVLRLPVEQQQAEVQSRETKLLRDGGSLKDAANFERLKSAVNNNVKQLGDSPLTFYQNRSGQAVAPIDFTQPEAAASGFEERAEILGALRKQYGASVALKPLLPNEAQALSSELNRATPAEAIDAFASLHSALQTPELYRAAVQQVAPDSPVTALAGMMATKDTSVTTARHWFGPDATIPAREVATTMLEGERLLNPSKSAKTEDGRPQTKALYLPQVKPLQLAFQNAVGDAFAGRPGAAENAFAAVQAYYVGKAARSGKLASQSSDIDSGIVQESVSAVLGTTIDYHGAGKVFAPLGMDRSTFENRIERTFAATAKSRGLPPSLTDSFSQLGLRNAGDGTYYVTQGRSFLTDGSGAPIVLDVNKPLTSGASGSYDASATGRW